MDMAFPATWWNLFDRLTSCNKILMTQDEIWHVLCRSCELPVLPRDIEETLGPMQACSMFLEVEVAYLDRIADQDGEKVIICSKCQATYIGIASDNIDACAHCAHVTKGMTTDVYMHGSHLTKHVDEKARLKLHDFCACEVRPKSIRLTGSPKQVAHAKGLLMELVDPRCAEVPIPPHSEAFMRWSLSEGHDCPS